MSNDFNQVVLVGRLTRDPELKYTPNGVAVASLSIAVNKQWKDSAGQQKEKVSFVDVEAWQKLAEIVGQYLKKGRLVLIAGELEQDRWKDKQSGQDRSKLKVRAERVQFLERGESSGQQGGAEASTGGPSDSSEPPF